MSQERPVRSYAVDELPLERPLPGVERRCITGEQAMIAEIHLATGTRVDRHKHPNEQFARILSGALRFHIGEVGDPDAYEIVARAGDIVHIPGNAVHGAEVLEEARVLDIFAPPGAMGIDSQAAP